MFRFANVIEKYAYDITQQIEHPTFILFLLLTRLPMGTHGFRQATSNSVDGRGGEILFWVWG